LNLGGDRFLYVKTRPCSVLPKPLRRNSDPLFTSVAPAGFAAQDIVWNAGATTVVAPRISVDVKRCSQTCAETQRAALDKSANAYVTEMDV
jgi:hypothetical protein